MKATVKSSIKAVLMLLCLFVSIVTAAGAITHGFQASEHIYTVTAVIQIIVTLLVIYREIKLNP